ncbi:DNA-binding transcriptional regulator, MerR family [Hydrocarboniphaga daqingensis]|uniref:DNA-binding transcriptional regulator, MerR family n=1 Tax=Hydrocarboniphaga daqingensis TaxID=490188 RepID=A0A1M5NDL5_9GAMM|nr:MerR family transcriptional regulator [Hydrocarboniphaga daqingensis]SHG87545.1 DNA-binding transcriptional regulator, MerR family [Hydrocarboniphaga daqingensis]
MPRKKTSERTDAPYRIKAVAALTGVSRETIRYYINEGLLPPPVKSARNMGWYTDRHVELLRLIQKLQAERFLPLKAIKAVFEGADEADFSVPQQRAFDEMRRHIATEHRDLPLAGSFDALAARMGLSAWETGELKRCGIGANGEATLSDLEISRQWIAIRDAGFNLERGFSPADLMYFQDVVEIAFRTELSLFRRRVGEIDERDSAKVIDVVIPALNRIFEVLHQRRVAAFLEARASGQTMDAAAASTEPVRRPEPAAHADSGRASRKSRVRTTAPS